MNHKHLEDCTVPITKADKEFARIIDQFVTWIKRARNKNDEEAKRCLDMSHQFLESAWHPESESE